MEEFYKTLVTLGYEKFADLFYENGITTVEDIQNASHTQLANILPPCKLKDFCDKHLEYFTKQKVSSDSSSASRTHSDSDTRNSGGSSTLSPPHIRNPLQDISASRTQNNISNSVHDSTLSTLHEENPIIDVSNENNGAEKVNRIFVAENVDLKKILQNNFEGKFLMQFYSSNRTFTPSKRTRLVHVLMCGILSPGIRPLTAKDLLIIRRKIVELFPNEKGEIYYSPAISQSESCSGRSQKATGKILHKYLNLKRIPSGVSRTNLPVDDDSDDELPSEEVQNSIDWLTDNEEPWDTALVHWNQTYSYRHKNDEPNKFVNSLFEIWTILKSPQAFELIDIDFNLSKICVLPKAIDGFHNFYDRVSEIRCIPKEDLCNILKEKLINPHLPSDSKVFIQLCLLSYMVVSNARISLGEKRFWKPSCIESFEGIVTHVKGEGNIEKAKEERRVFCAERRIRLQPYVLAVGNEDFDVDSVYLIIDDVQYKIPTLLQAIDYCFKSFHVFCAEYPPQSNHLWLVLQHCLYQFRTRWDPLELKVVELLNDLNIDLPDLNLNSS